MAVLVTVAVDFGMEWKKIYESLEKVKALLFS